MTSKRNDVRLSARARHALQILFGSDSRPEQWAAAYQQEPYFLLAEPGVGKTTDDEVRKFLADHGLIDPRQERREKKACAVQTEMDRLRRSRKRIEDQARLLGGKVDWTKDLMRLAVAKQNKKRSKLLAWKERRAQRDNQRKNEDVI